MNKNRVESYNYYRRVPRVELNSTENGCNLTQYFLRPCLTKLSENENQIKLGRVDWTSVGKRTQVYISIYYIYTRVSGRGGCRPPGPSALLRGFGIVEKMETSTCQVPRNVLLVVMVWCGV